MTQIRVELPEALTSMPVKAFLTQHEGISSTQWKRIKHSGTFRVGGILCNAARTEVRTGDIITFDIVRPSDIEPEDLPLDIRYEDDYLLIVNKPAGQLVHPTTKEAHGTLGNAVLYWYKAHGEHHAYHPVHRLDRNTSGLVLIAKVPQVQYKLTPRHGEGKLFHREYLALIEGELTPPEGLIDAPIARALPSIILRKVSPDGQTARTHYDTVRTDGKLSLVHLVLDTGRTHQIRAHLAHLGYPICGDDRYGDREKKLDILKDPHCGAFAVIRLCSYFVAYFALCCCVQFTPQVGAVWLLALVLERACSGYAVAAFPLAKNTGLAHTFATAADRTTVRRVLGCLGIVLAVALFALGGGVLVLVAGVALWRYHRVAVKQFGGITGDLAGWFLQKAEFWMLAALAASQWGGIL